MGVWSYPLFTSPANLRFKKSLISSDSVKDMENYSYFSNKHQNEYTLNEFQMECYDNAKIYGYITNDFAHRFTKFFEQISKQQEDDCCKEFELHFFCIDDNFPYILKWKDNELQLLVGTEYNIHYFVENPDYKSDNNNPEFVFDKEKYKKNYKKSGAMNYSNLKRLLW